MTILTDQAKSHADNLVLELKNKLSVELSDDDWRTILRTGQIIALETVILVKNKINNLQNLVHIFKQQVEKDHETYTYNHTKRNVWGNISDVRDQCS